MLLETFSPERLCNFLASGEFGFNFCFFKRSNSFVVVSFFKRYFCQSSSETIPISLPFSVRRMSALSSLKISLYSALLVNILYGSFVPRLTRSSIKTPIYASSLFNSKTPLFLVFRAAFIPATMPCAAASSYPVVPFICPAK